MEQFTTLGQVCEKTLPAPPLYLGVYSFQEILAQVLDINQCMLDDPCLQKATKHISKSQTEIYISSCANGGSASSKWLTLAITMIMKKKIKKKIKKEKDI